VLDLKFSFFSYSSIVKKLTIVFNVDMDTSVVPDASSFTLDIDSTTRNITSIQWNGTKKLELIHDGAAKSVDGLLTLLALDPKFRDTGGRLVYAPQALSF